MSLQQIIMCGSDRERGRALLLAELPGYALCAGYAVLRSGYHFNLRQGFLNIIHCF